MPVISLFTLSPPPSGFMLLLTLLSFQRPRLDIVLRRVFRHFFPAANIFWLFIQENLWQDIFPCIPPCIANLWYVTETWWTVVIKGQKSQSWPGEGTTEVEYLKFTVIIESALIMMLHSPEGNMEINAMNHKIFVKQMSLNTIHSVLPLRDSLTCMIWMKGESF